MRCVRSLLTMTILCLCSTSFGLVQNPVPRDSRMLTKIREPRERKLTLKLPLLQPAFHFVFLNPADVLAGKLTLRIIRDEKPTDIVIFADGKLCEGWEALPAVPSVKDGLYFAFASTHTYATAPGDKLKLELVAKSDLKGIGAMETGFLPGGTYTSEGTYTILTDEFDTNPVLERMKAQGKEITPEFMKNLETVRERYSHKAGLESWSPQWPLKITAEEGWLPPEKAAQVRKLLEHIEATKRETSLGDARAVSEAFYEAVAKGDDAKAQELSREGEFRQGFDQLRQHMDLAKGRINRVWADSENACAVTTFMPTKDAEGTFAFGLGLCKVNGRWIVRDLDALPNQQALDGFVAGFRKLAPTAVEVEGISAPPAAASPSPLLQFRLVEKPGTPNCNEMKDSKSGEVLWLSRKILLSEADIQSAAPTQDGQGRWNVRVTLTPDGARKLEQVTRANVGRRLAVLIEEQVVSAPRIASAIRGGPAIIAIGGKNAREEAQRIARALQSAIKERPGGSRETTGPAFGLVIERTVNHSGENCMIDFDTGKLFPGTLPTEVTAKGSEAVSQWVAKQGIDAGGGMQPEIMGLIAFDLIAFPAPNEYWESKTPTSLLADRENAFKVSKPGNPVYLSTRGVVPATWTFRTREGGVGILQILGLTDKPKGVKIRYKMVRSDKPKE